MLKEKIFNWFKKNFSKNISVLDYLFVLRPTLFFPIWTITIAGYGAAYFFNNEPVYWSWTVNLRFCLEIFFITILAGATFILNQLEDIKSDQLNQKLFLISENHIHKDFALKYAYTLAVIAIVGEFFIHPVASVIFVLFFFLWGVAYNKSPFQWKDKPIMGILTNIAGGALCFFAGWAMRGDLQWLAVVKVIPYLFAFGAVSLLTTIPDMDGDKVNDKATFPVKYGLTLTIWISFIWVLLALIIGIQTRDPVISIPSLLSLPLYVILVFQQNIKWVFRCIRWPVLFIALTVSVMFPWFFILIFITFYLARFYYLIRFDLDYPTFRV